MASRPGAKRSRSANGGTRPAKTAAPKPKTKPDPAALRAAAEAGKVTQLRAIIGAGVDLNAADAQGFTALHNAAIAGSASCIRALLAAGANVNAACNGSGQTPICFAAHGTDAAVVKLLLDHGATVPEPAVVIDTAGSPEVAALIAAAAGVPATDVPPRRRALTRAEWKRSRALVDDVFATLRAAGVVALVDAGFTQQMAFAAVQDEYHAHPDPSVWGFCFTTSQDMERARTSNEMPIGFGGADGSDAETVRVGQLVCDAFRAAGCQVRWAGTPAARPSVYFVSG